MKTNCLEKFLQRGLEQFNLQGFFVQIDIEGEKKTQNNKEYQPWVNGCGITQNMTQVN